MKELKYCVAIRTLGKAGEKYQQELNSLKNQTIPPSKILVYIAEGYPLPKETIGIEQYVYVKKGMVAQRAIPFAEVDTDYVLLLDDDVYVPEDGVEKLFAGLSQLDGDVIAADTFPNQNMSVAGKLAAFLTGLVYPRRDDGYAFKVQKNASFSYNNHPTDAVYLSETAAGPASLWKVKALRGIHFEHELWMDKLGFAYGDDLLFFYKLVKNGGRLLVHYTSGILHLDAQSERKNYNENPKRFCLRSQIGYILWYRTCYNLPNLSAWSKGLAAASFGFKILWNSLILLLYSIVKLNYRFFLNHLKGTWAGRQFVRSRSYQEVPNFILE